MTVAEEKVLHTDKDTSEDIWSGGGEERLSSVHSLLPSVLCCKFFSSCVCSRAISPPTLLTTQFLSVQYCQFAWCRQHQYVLPLTPAHPSPTLQRLKRASCALRWTGACHGRMHVQPWRRSRPTRLGAGCCRQGTASGLIRAHRTGQGLGTLASCWPHRWVQAKHGLGPVRQGTALDTLKYQWRLDGAAKSSSGEQLASSPSRSCTCYDALGCAPMGP